MSLCSASPRTSLASERVVTACAFVHCTRSCLLRARLMRPLAAMPPAATNAIMPTSRSWRGLSVLGGCEDIVRFDLVRLGLHERAQARAPPSFYHGRERS